MPITAIGHVGIDDLERALHAHRGELGQLPADRGHVGDAEEVARRDAQQLAPLPPPETAGVVRVERRPSARGTPRRVAFAVEVVGIAQRIEQRRRRRRRPTPATRDAHASATSPSRTSGCSDELVGELGMRLDRPLHEHAGGARVGRALDRGVEVGARARASSRRSCRQCRVSCSWCPGSVSPPRSSTSSSAISTATSTRMLDAYERADAAGCDLVVFPELTVTGYPPEDLLLRPAFVAQCAESLDKFAARTGRTAPRWSASRRRERDLANAAAVCAHGRVQGVYRKHLLPELRGVRRAALLRAVAPVDGPLFVVAGVRVGVSICEDAWSPTARSSRRPRAAPSSSSTSTRRRTTRAASHERETMLATRAADASVPDRLREPRRRPGRARLRRRVAACSTRAVTSSRARKQFDEDLLVVDVDVRPAFRKRLLDPRGRVARDRAARGRGQRGAPRRAPRRPAIEPLLPPVHEVYEALVLGTRDYVRKNGFTDVLIGLSGGIDSSLVAAIAVDALGPEHVTGVLMPSRYSSEGSVTDADALAAQPRHPHAHRPDRAGARRVPRRCSPSRSTAPSPGSPRRTCRRASAATS